MRTPESPTSRRQILAAGLLTPLGLLAACSGETPKDVNTADVPSPTPSTPEPSPTPTPEPTWPLTGKTGDITSRPAMSVKIENTAAARPQTGLQQADVVWEEMVEGGITRHSAVFHSRLPDSLGPVRSVRPMDAAIAAPYNGLMVFSGGQKPFIEALRKAGLQLFANDLSSPGFHRSSDRYAPHNLFAKPKEILKNADSEHQDPPPEQLLFATEKNKPTAVADGKKAGSIAISFPSSHPGWDWDGKSKAWRRTESGDKAMTTDSGQITAVNVVVLRVKVVATSYRDPAGNPVPDTELKGEGEAIVATGGKTLKCRWSKDGVQKPLVLQADGDDVLLAPGNTWIELVPRDGSSVQIG